MKIAVVVGTSHYIQIGKNQKDDFKSYLIDLCQQHNIKTIAEEINDDASFVVAKDVCHCLGIDHKIIDPNPTEYNELGVTHYHTIEYEVMNKYYLNSKPSTENDTPPEALSEFQSRIRNEHCRPREIEWLKRIQDYGHWPVLVICGSDHFEPFCALLSDNDITLTTGESRWGK